MDYSRLIETFGGIACIISMDQDKCGEEAITISAANRDYLASVNRLDEEFVPGRSYTYYVPSDPNFEALVESCISRRKIAHQYVNAGFYNAWLDIYMLPLEDDGSGKGHCLFTYEMTSESDSDKMISISAKTAYNVLKTCIKFRENNDFVETLSSIVKDIRLQCESDGCAIILIDKHERKIDITCFDYNKKAGFIPPEEDVFFRPEFYDIVKNWQDIMAGSNCFIITDEEELRGVEKKDENWYRSLISSGVKNLVLYPLRVGDNLYGYIFASNFNSDKIPFIREVMELNSFILSAEAENYRMRQTLEMMGTTDMLTGVRNRNAMNRRLTDHKNCPGGCGTGVIFADLNGLKTVNDAHGHSEGDEMLKAVAETLKAVFADKEIYRAGGDEFLIITNDLPRDEFYSRFEKLRSMSSAKGQPPFALGAHFDDTGMDIGSIMQMADKNMYADKTDFYRRHPDLDRRSSR